MTLRYGSLMRQPFSAAVRVLLVVPTIYHCSSLFSGGGAKLEVHTSTEDMIIGNWLTTETTTARLSGIAFQSNAVEVTFGEMRGVKMRLPASQLIVLAGLPGARGCSMHHGGRPGKTGRGRSHRSHRGGLPAYRYGP